MAAKPLARWRLAARAAGIWARVTKHWIRFWIGWALLWLRRAGRERRRAWLGRVVVDLFRELGATFIKVGQIMSTRPDLLPEYISTALAELQDSRRAVPVRGRGAHGRGRSRAALASLYAEFAPVPLASASVSQVHKARLPDGRIVAVKVRRPNVVELCAFDLVVMRQGARLLNLIPSVSTLAPVAAVDEFGRAIFAQLDFRIEARQQPPLPRTTSAPTRTSSSPRWSSRCRPSGS